MDLLSNFLFLVPILNSNASILHEREMACMTAIYKLIQILIILRSLATPVLIIFTVRI